MHTALGFTAQFLMFEEEALVPSEVIVGIPQLEGNPSAYSFLRYQRLSIV